MYSNNKHMAAVRREFGLSALGGEGFHTSISSFMLHLAITRLLCTM